MSFINQLCRQLTGRSFPKDLEYEILPYLLPEKHPRKELLQDIQMMRRRDILTKSSLTPVTYLQAVDRSFIVIPVKTFRNSPSNIAYRNTHWDNSENPRYNIIKIINFLRTCGVLLITPKSKFGTQKEAMKLFSVAEDSSEEDKQRYVDSRYCLEQHIEKELKRWKNYELGDQWESGIPGFVWYRNELILQNVS
tara:strand:- start:1083 stop:1664 length:582 start_codon:yes stop_codon:yes gene_type:complete